METITQQLVAEFLNEYRARGSYLREHITRLAEQAISEDRNVAEPASRAFFTSLVERLADSFEPDAVTLYNRAFAQLIQTCRLSSRAGTLDDLLNGFELRTEEDLIARAVSLRSVSPLNLPREQSERIRRVIVLSRVTLGADVAITSVIVERMKQRFPQAEVFLLGGRKASELFGGDSRVQFKEIAYLRGGTALERLFSWIDALNAVRDLTSDLRNGEYLIVDPDTRLTQLGLLPVTGRPRVVAGATRSGDTTDYLFFPSREYGSDTNKSLGELTSDWLDEVLSEKTRTYPCVTLNAHDLESANRVAQAIKRSRSGPIVTINFGVGENSAKRISDEFEASLVATLIRDGATVILDKGAGREETSRADRVTAAALEIESGDLFARSIELNEENLASSADRLDVDLIVWNGRIGMLAGLIGVSDLYIGYDSAGQHIAAALGVPCIDVFAGFSSPRMPDRWKPFGRAEAIIVLADTLGAEVTSGTVLSETLRNAFEILNS